MQSIASYLGHKMQIINPYRYTGGGGGGGVTVEAFATETTAVGTTITAPAPTGITSGELLVIILAGETVGYTTPTGWTLAVTEAASGSSLAVFYKVSDGTETDVPITMSTTLACVAWFLRVSGAGTSFDVTGTPATGFGTSHAIGEVTTTVDSCLAFYALSFDGADGLPYSVSGTGWSESDEQRTGDTGNTGSSGCWGTKQQETAGATGIATVSSNTSDGANYVQFAIAPA